MASILENLISDIQSFAAEQIERQVTDALSAAQKAGMTNAAELAKYTRLRRISRAASPERDRISVDRSCIEAFSNLPQ